MTILKGLKNTLAICYHDFQDKNTNPEHLLSTLLNAFKESSFNIGKMAFRPESKYTRVHSIYRNITDIDDKDEIKKLMDELWLKSKLKIDKTTKIIESFKW